MEHRGVVEFNKFAPNPTRATKPCKANRRGRWINTVASPGWYARGRYGREVLKHSQSWIKLGLKSSWVEYKPGTFKPCNKPKHHSCLDNMPGNGNIPYFSY